MTDVSVILCTWNNRRRLAVTLDAVMRCRVAPGLRWELVLVNNNCTDQTADVAAGFADRLPLVYVEEPRQGLSRAKNAGIAAASGALLVFTDDDIRPCRDWIALCIGRPTVSWAGDTISGAASVRVRGTREARRRAPASGVRRRCRI